MCERGNQNLVQRRRDPVLTLTHDYTYDPNDTDKIGPEITLQSRDKINSK